MCDQIFSDCPTGKCRYSFLQPIYLSCGNDIFVYRNSFILGSACPAVAALWLVFSNQTAVQTPTDSNLLPWAVVYLKEWILWVWETEIGAGFDFSKWKDVFKHCMSLREVIKIVRRTKRNRFMGLVTSYQVSTPGNSKLSWLTSPSRAW